ncbi:MAG TPA: GNAT family N-acetyltransferase [Acetobacteraceae bacterium]|nr:GNAT family N-acetyltransferase [Acetobacteraceae bacterium]
MIAATAAHAEALAAIHRAAFPPRGAQGEAWGADAIGVQLGLPGTFAMLDPRGGMILARVIADQAEVLTLAVSPASRRRGVATALLEAVLRESAARGAGAVFLEVSSANLPARALYAAAGFRQVGWRPHYYPDRSDALVLRADLSPSAAPGC